MNAGIKIPLFLVKDVISVSWICINYRQIYVYSPYGMWILKDTNERFRSFLYTSFNIRNGAMYNFPDLIDTVVSKTHIS